jgi:hypothetical protein
MIEHKPIYNIFIVCKVKIKQHRRCAHNTALRRNRIFASWILLRQSYHWIHCGNNSNCSQFAHIIHHNYYCKILLKYFFVELIFYKDTWWHSWFRHCATRWKVTGSITDGITGIFCWHNTSSLTMALGSTQPLTEMSTRNISWEWRQPVCRADNLSTFMC